MLNQLVELRKEAATLLQLRKILQEQLNRLKVGRSRNTGTLSIIQHILAHCCSSRFVIRCKFVGLSG
uniref:Uncharacterized protein n=1 Tax=Eptatretus burgeri TaxID=7764 RepID=A0A8C4WUU1_EPTBU